MESSANIIKESAKISLVVVTIQNVGSPALPQILFEPMTTMTMT